MGSRGSGDTRHDVSRGTPGAIGSGHARMAIAHRDHCLAAGERVEARPLWPDSYRSGIARLRFCSQIRRSARSAPRLIAEGYGRFLPREFVKYLRWANGELKETFDALQDGREQGYFSEEETIRSQRLTKRASKAIGALIRYLETAKPPEP